MARYNLLKMVQKIGVGIGSDEISQLDENDEVHDIQEILEDTYNFVLTRRHWVFMQNVHRALEDDATSVARVGIPDGVRKIQWMKYRDHEQTGRIAYAQPIYKTPAEFLEIVHSRDNNDADITMVLNENGIPMPIITNRTPRYWTSFNETHITFDSYVSDATTGVVGEDAIILGIVAPTMDFTDPVASFPVPEQMEQLIYNEALADCAVKLRQTQDPKAEKRAFRLWGQLLNTEPKTEEDIEEIDYGRKRRSRH